MLNKFTAVSNACLLSLMNSAVVGRCSRGGLAIFGGVHFKAYCCALRRASSIIDFCDGMPSLPRPYRFFNAFSSSFAYSLCFGGSNGT